jgi:hypothetical protein
VFAARLDAFTAGIPAADGLNDERDALPAPPTTTRRRSGFLPAC